MMDYKMQTQCFIPTFMGYIHVLKMTNWDFGEPNFYKVVMYQHDFFIVIMYK